MAATATQQIIQNGPRNLVLKYTIAGTTGDVSGLNLVNLSTLDDLGAGGLRLEKAKWSLTGCSCKLQWEGPSSKDLIEMQGTWGDYDFSCNGGIVNNATDQTGNITYTTTGYGAGGDGGHIILYFKKRSGTAVTSPSPDMLVGTLTLTGTTPTVTVA